MHSKQSSRDSSTFQACRPFIAWRHSKSSWSNQMPVFLFFFSTHILFFPVYFSKKGFNYIIWFRKMLHSPMDVHYLFVLTILSETTLSNPPYSLTGSWLYSVSLYS